MLTRIRNIRKQVIARTTTYARKVVNVGRGPRAKETVHEQNIRKIMTGLEQYHKATETGTGHKKAKQ
jgi:hypothetical protein